MEATLNEIRIKGIQILKEGLTPTELIRFFQVYERGTGDYTTERKEIYKNIKLEDIKKGIIELRKKKQNKRIKSETAHNWA